MTSATPAGDSPVATDQETPSAVLADTGRRRLNDNCTTNAGRARSNKEVNA